ncbi:5'-nucleotidase [Herbaspirillum sp. SJZ107]|uniref:5'-nucleotidase n=1 Tax=Herbaspirillum sp. SJZ107 TaxID=2572881 RepID=UPI0011524878
MVVTYELKVDEACFLGGLNKGPFLTSFGADVFFDNSSAVAIKPPSTCALVTFPMV